MKITYFFRKASPQFHSIEELFFNIQKHLPSGFEYKNYFAKQHSKGFFNRLFIAINVVNQQNEINHITGDIHFACFFMNKKKTILTIHDLGSILRGNKIKRKILKLFWYSIPAKRVSYITVISEFTKKQLLENINIKSEKIVVIPNCISSELKYIPKSFNTKKPTILHIGTKNNKNLERTIEAIKEIDCIFNIVGKLSVTQLELLNINQITFHNLYNLDYSKIIELYNQADILLFVSTYEGFGVPIIEANATGTCVITSNISPMQEIANNAAIIVDPYIVNEIKNAINKIINSEQIRKTLIENGLINAKKYSAKNIAKTYSNLYKQII